MGEIAFENGRFSDFQGLVTVTLDRVILHTVMHYSSTGCYGLIDKCSIFELHSIINWKPLRSKTAGSVYYDKPDVLAAIHPTGMYVWQRHSEGWDKNDGLPYFGGGWVYMWCSSIHPSESSDHCTQGVCLEIHKSHTNLSPSTCTQHWLS